MTSADRPRRPALTSSTPAVPGTYPRNSSVLSTNRWGLAARRPNLKQNPTSYFSFRPHPNCNSPSSTSPSPSHTPQFSPLQPPSPANFDIRFTVHSPGSPDSEFSTRAFAGTGSSRGASPLPSPLPTSPLPESTPAGESETLQVPTIPKTAPLSVDGTFPTDKDMNTKHDEKTRTSLDGSATAVSTSHGRKVKLHVKNKSHENPVPAAAAAASNVVPLPSVAPFSSVLTSTGKTKSRSPSSSSSQARRPSFGDHLDSAPVPGSKEVPVHEDDVEDGEDASAQTRQKYVFEPMPTASPEREGGGKGKGVLAALKGRLRIGKKGKKDEEVGKDERVVE